MEILISTLVILLLMFLGMKVFGSFLAGSLLYVLLTGSGQATVAPLISFSINNSALLAVPLFMLAGGDVGTERERFNTGHYWRDLGGSFWSSIPALMLPVLMMGGIYSGICTATEAGAVGCVYALVMGVFAFRKINRKNGLNEFVKAGKSLGSIFIIFPMVMLFSRFMLIEGVPQLVVQGFTAITENKYVILILMNIVLLLAGMFFDASVLTLVITPLLLPTAAFIGLDAIQLGVIIFVAIGIGTITPPMAMNLFVVSSIGKVSIKEMMSPLLPYLLFGALPILLLVTFVPAVSLWLPALVLK